MGRFRVVALAVVLAAVAALAGCASPERSVPTIPVGVASLDGDLRVWPGRGPMINGVNARIAVTAAVDDWRTPAGDRPRLSSSGIVYLGTVDDTSVALVIADVPHFDAQWLLQLSGSPGGGAYRIVSARQYSELGYLAYADVLPVRLGADNRYVVSERVDTMTAYGDELPIVDGLSAPVEAVRCAVSPLSLRLRKTEALPEGALERLADLGTGVEEPMYPLILDNAGTAQKVLGGLDMCVLGARSGPFGSLEPRRSPTAPPADYPQVPISWPVATPSQRLLAELPDDLGGGTLTNVAWRGVGGAMRALLYRPVTGPPSVSRAEGTGTRIQVYERPIDGRKHMLVAWPTDWQLLLPDGTTPIWERSGLAILEMPTADLLLRVRLPNGDELNRTV